MQCNQPFYGTGFPNCGQFYPYNTAIQCNGPYPEVIGEGDVTTLVLPDGTTQLYFLPVSKWCAPQSFDPNFARFNNPYWNTNYGVWFIRSVSNPIPHSLCHQNHIKSGFPLARPSFSHSSNIAIPCADFHVKFHNDCWTSTTDLQYFFPRIRTCNTPKISAGVQVAAMPLEKNTVCLYEVVCNKPCHCAPNYCCGDKTETNRCTCNETAECKKATIPPPDENRNGKKKNHKCECYPESDPKGASSQSCMSVDEKPKRSSKDEKKRSSKDKKKRSEDEKRRSKDEKKQKSKNKQLTSSSAASSESRMSIDESCAKHDRTKDKTKEKKKGKKEKKSQHICECGSPLSERNTANTQSSMSIDKKPTKSLNYKKAENQAKDKEKKCLLCDSLASIGYAVSRLSCSTTQDSPNQKPTSKDKLKSNKENPKSKSKLESPVSNAGNQGTERKKKGPKDLKCNDCECDLPAPDTSNKLTATFTDQASGSMRDKEQGSQTDCRCIAAHNVDVRTELWFPKGSAKMAPQHDTFLGVCFCETDTTNSVCSCYSDYAGDDDL